MRITTGIMNGEIRLIALLSVACPLILGADLSAPGGAAVNGTAESAGGIYRVIGTVGASMGSMAGGLYEVQADSRFSSSPEIPLLWIQSEHNTPTVYWTRPAGGWLLESTFALEGAATLWASVTPQSCQTNETTLSKQELAPIPSVQFYRLRAAQGP